MNYGIKIWSENRFIIREGKLKVNYKSSPYLIDIVQEIRNKGIYGPLLLRFPHLIKRQIELIYTTFNNSIKEISYNGKFNAVFPLKVNQFPNFLTHLVKFGKKYGYGLEAGSKAELILAMTYNNKNAPITVNGFKDREMIRLCFLASKLEHNITIIIEGINELESIIDISKECTIIPNIGIRIRLHSSGKGVWAKSGGINAKFGLNSTEIIKAIQLLKENNLLDKFQMIHFHIGSLLNDIAPLKKALREAGNIYAELRKMGANGLNSINIGGGLSVEYAQHKNQIERHYNLNEYANDVVFMLKEIARSKEVIEPNIYIESGRYIASSHAVIVAPVLELLSSEYNISSLKLKEKNPPLITELYALYNDINSKNALEYLHDAIDHLESLLTLFDLGYIDLIDRSNTEILVNLIIKKASSILGDIHKKELDLIKNLLEERYLLNFSLFQSMPDFWGIGQHFPIMPLTKLDKYPNRSATLWDITCDSDGEIPFKKESPLYLHDIDLDYEEYFLGIFLVGAYQEILSMKHNLFAKPTEAIIDIDSKGYKISDIKESPTILEIFENLEYNIKDIIKLLSKRMDNNSNLKNELNNFLYDNNYLKTTTLKEKD